MNKLNPSTGDPTDVYKINVSVGDMSESSINGILITVIVLASVILLFDERLDRKKRTKC